MGEAYLKKFGGDDFIVESAGFEPGELNPFAVEAMKEDGIDISSNSTDDVFDFFKQGKFFHYIITVCAASLAEQCPIFPRVPKKIAWSFDDPSSFTGTNEERLAKTRMIRDQIKQAVLAFVEQEKAPNHAKIPG